MATLRSVAEDAVTEAIGRSHRDDPVAGAAGGPAGNARLTAWIGVLLLVLFLAELITLADLRSLISWHVAIGIILIPPAIAKTGSTGWRIVRYYTGTPAYRRAGPPPLALRVLGPIVIAATLAVLGTGLGLVLVSPITATSSIVGGVTLLMLHKAAFVVWGVATGLHTMGRFVPAARLITTRIAVPGSAVRFGAIAVTAAVAVVVGLLGVQLAGPWHDARVGDHHRDRVHANRR